MKDRIVVHQDLEVYQKSFEAAMRIFELSKGFPKEETHSLTDQIRLSSRAVCAHVAEAWRNRRSEKGFTSSLSHAEGEAAATQVWIEFAAKCGYLETEEARTLYRAYHAIINTLVGMINHPESWIASEGDKAAHPEAATTN